MPHRLHLPAQKPPVRKPLDIATAIQQHMPSSDLLSSVEVAPPGFLNMRLNTDWVLGQIERIIADGEKFFQQNVGEGRPAQVEFVSANPTGPLHIGRTRGAILGDTLAKLLEQCGWDVQREYYFNNAGRQMEMLGRSLQTRYLQALGDDIELPEDGYQGTYLIDIAETIKAENGESLRDANWGYFKEHAEAEIFAMIKATLGRVGH